tara:strand:- start:68 stop:229 length:162 start_codon:yes stop_codon:yes gene_type:complete
MSEIEIGDVHEEEESPMRLEIRSHFSRVHLGLIVGLLVTAIAVGLIVGLTVQS